MKKIYFALMAAVVAMSFSSCSSKKELLSCQEENKSLMTNWQGTKEDLAAAKAQISGLNSQISGLNAQLKAQEKTNAEIQRALDKSLSTGTMSNANIAKLVEQIGTSNQYIRYLTEMKSKSDSLNLSLPTTSPVLSAVRN